MKMCCGKLWRHRFSILQWCPKLCRDIWREEGMSVVIMGRSCVSLWNQNATFLDNMIRVHTKFHQYLISQHHAYICIKADGAVGVGEWMVTLNQQTSIAWLQTSKSTQHLGSTKQPGIFLNDNSFQCNRLGRYAVSGHKPDCWQEIATGPTDCVGRRGQGSENLHYEPPFTWCCVLLGRNSYYKNCVP